MYSMMGIDMRETGSGNWGHLEVEMEEPVDAVYEVGNYVLSRLLFIIMYIGTEQYGVTCN
jgi:hypothetical protein